MPGSDPEILVRHAGFVRALARSLTRDEHETDDAVQQTWVAALTHPPRRSRPVRPWLAAVVRNASRRLRRDEVRRRDRERVAARPERAEPTASVVGREEILRVVVEEVLALREPYRQTVLLRFYEGLSYTEIAARRGVGVEAVRSQLKRARAQLRARLDHKCGAVAWLPALAALVGRPERAAAGMAAWGGIVMGTKLKLVACVVVALTCLAVWRAWPSGTVAPRAEVAGERGGQAPAPALQVEAPAPRASQPVAGAVVHVVRGRVAEASGKPIRGASVFIGAEEDPFGDAEPVHVSPPHLYGRILRTGEDGAFDATFDGPRHLFVWLIGREQDGIRPAGWRTPETSRWVDTPAQDITLLATVLPTARVRVRVHNAAEGSPLASFQCRFEVDGRVVATGECTDGLLDRNVVLPEAARERPVRVSVTLTQPAVTSPPSRDVYLQVGAEAEVDLVLVQGGRLRGIVMDREGRPVADALVFLGDPSRGRGNDPFDGLEPRRIGDGVRTADDGTFELLGADAQSQVTVWHPTHATASVPIESAARIELRPRGAIHGRVLDADGRPVSGFSVKIIDDRPQESDADGRFALEALDPGWCGLKIGRGRFLGVEVRAGAVTEVTIQPGLPRVELEPLSGGHPFGEPLKGAMGGQGAVFLAFEAGAKDGPLVLEDVWPGRYLFLGQGGRIGWADIREEHAVLDLGAEELRVQGPPHTRVFVVPAGVPEPCRVLASKMTCQRIPAGGEVVFAPLPAGRYEVCVERETHPRATVEVPSGEPVKLD